MKGIVQTINEYWYMAPALMLVPFLFIPLKRNKNMLQQKTQIIPLLRQEEGVRYTPYADSLGYPTVGVGFKLGPQGASLKNYTFTLCDGTIDAWLTDDVAVVLEDMQDDKNIAAALTKCNQPRKDILTSMAFQMGVEGLANFKNALQAIQDEDWNQAALEMLDSTWAEQTPNRAERHAAVIKSGRWRPTYKFSLKD